MDTETDIEFKIRPATLEDLDQIVEIEARASRNPWSRKVFELEAKNPDSINLVLTTAENKIVSYMFSWAYGEELEVQNLCTDLDFRRRGFAKNLFDRTICEARGKNIKKAYLEVRASNIEAIELYRQFGFEVTTIRKKYYSDRENALQMQCDLSKY